MDQLRTTESQPYCKIPYRYIPSVEAEMSPHTINLATQKAFKVDTAARLLGRVRKVVGFFYCSVRAAGILQDKEKQLALPIHKLIQYVSTRWNSSQDTLERLLEQKPDICAPLMSRGLRRGEEVNTLKDKGFCEIVDIFKLMAPVKLVTTSMCEDNDFPCLIKNFEASDEDSVVIREMKQALRNDLEKRYTGLDDLFYTAAALDPRFKSLPFLTDHDAERIFTSITAEATSLHNNVNPPTHCHLLNTKYILQCILLVTNSLLCFAAVIRFILTAFTVCLIVCTTH